MEDVELGALPAVHPAASMAETVRTELDLLSMDVSDHLMASYAPLLEPAGGEPG